MNFDQGCDAMPSQGGSPSTRRVMQVVRSLVKAALTAIMVTTMGACDFGPSDEARSTPTSGATSVAPSGELSILEIHTPQATVWDEGTEDYPLPNCGGSAALKQSLGMVATVEQSVSIDHKATGTVSAEMSIPAAVKLQLSAAVENSYSKSFKSALERATNISMEAAPKTHVVYWIAWSVHEYAATIDFELDGVQYSVPYVYRLRTPKIVASDAVPCAADGATEPPISAEGDLSTPAVASAQTRVVFRVVTGYRGTMETPTLRLFTPDAAPLGEYPLVNAGGFQPYGITHFDLLVPWTFCEMGGFDIGFSEASDWLIEEVYLEIDGELVFASKDIGDGRPDGSWYATDAWQARCP